MLSLKKFENNNGFSGAGADETFFFDSGCGMGDALINDFSEENGLFNIQDALSENIIND